MNSPDKITPSELTDALAPFHVMEVLERAKEIEKTGADVIHLEIGEPDLPTPPEVVKAGIDAIKAGETFYSPSLGIAALREKIAEMHNSRYGLKISAGNVLVTSGSSPALLLAMHCLVNPGDEVVITNPHYACYPGIIKAAGGVPVTVPVYAEENYRIDAQRLKKRIGAKTKLMIVNSPASPTGAVLDDDSLKSVCSSGIFIISDEIYHGLEYGAKSKSILNHTDRAIAVNGFSKLCSMTGWRLGYMIAPEELMRPAQKLQQNLFISANPFVQRGGVAAISQVCPRADEIAGIYSKRKNAMTDALRKIGLSPRGNPQGAFYLFVKIPGANADSRSAAFDILEKTNVAVTPGIDFGSEGEGHLRFSYTAPIEKIEEGIRRIGEYLQR